MTLVSYCSGNMKVRLHTEPLTELSEGRKLLSHLSAMETYVLTLADSR